MDVPESGAQKRRRGPSSYSVCVKFKYRRLRLVTGITTAESALAALERMREIRFHDPGAVIVVDETTGDAVPEAWLADAAAAARTSSEGGERAAHLGAAAIATYPPAADRGAVLAAREHTEPSAPRPTAASAQDVLARAQQVHARARATVAATLDTLRVAGVAPARIDDVERAMREIDVCFANALATFAAIADSSVQPSDPEHEADARRPAGADDSSRPAPLVRARPRARTGASAPPVATQLPLRARRVTAPAPVEPAASDAPDARARSRSTA